MARGCVWTKDLRVCAAGVLSVCLVMAFAAAAAGGQASFQRLTGSPFTVGSQPYVEIADVNGDGRDDMVTGNRKDNTFSILLATDSGGFTEASNSPLNVGVTLYWQYCIFRPKPMFADMDEDGDLDMVCACAEGVAVLLNDGSGGFSHASGSPFSTGLRELYDRSDFLDRMWIPDPDHYGHPNGSILGDMNGDGHIDLVARTGCNYFITLLLGDGTGGLAAGDGYPIEVVRGDSPGCPFPGYSLGGGAHALGDFNSDGTMDILFPRGHYLMGTGAGGFVPGPEFKIPPTDASPWWLGVLDLDGDNDDDFMWCGGGSTVGTDTPPFYFFMSDGAGGFSYDVGIEDHRGNPVTADMNGDGHDDMVGVYGLFSSLPWGVFILYGDGAGNFTEGTPFNVWEWDDFRHHTHVTSVDDVNADGKPDIAISHGLLEKQSQSGPYDRKLDVLINTTSGAFAPVIQRPYLASGRVGESFSYRIQVTGTKPLSFGASPLPAGLSLSGDTISGTPTEEGQTEVALTATNSAGSDTRSLRVTVTDGTNRPPSVTAGPGASPNPAIINEMVAFSATATDPDGDTLSYRWTFGDGSTSSPQAAPAVSHVYATPGEYGVAVTVTDGKGGTAWGGVTVVVREEGGQGDLNGDKVVNVDDVTLVMSHHGQSSDNPNWDPRADANGDGKVDNADLLIVIENFGRVYE